MQSKSKLKREEKPKSQLAMLKIEQPIFQINQSRCKNTSNLENDNRIIVDNKSVIFSLQESTQDTTN